MATLPRAARRPVPPRRSTRCSTRCSPATASGAGARTRRRSPSSTGARCRPGPSSRSCGTRSSPPACRRSSAIRAIWCSTAERSRPAGDGSIWSTAACSSTTSSSRPDECRALVDAYSARAVCVANTFRCKLAHKKAFFAVLTDSRHEGLFSDDRARGDPRARARGRESWPTRRRSGTADDAGLLADRA